MAKEIPVGTTVLYRIVAQNQADGTSVPWPPVTMTTKFSTKNAALVSDSVDANGLTLNIRGKAPGKCRLSVTFTDADGNFFGVTPPEDLLVTGELPALPAFVGTFIE